MIYKTLPAPATSNKQVREYTEAVEKGFNSIFVTPSNRGWRVVQVSDKKKATTFTNKAAALNAAKKQAKDLNSSFFVFDKSGELVETR